MMLLMLAQSTNPVLHPSGNSLLIVAGCAVTLLTVYVLGLMAVSKHREVFGEQPPVADALRDLRKELEKYAPRATVDKMVEQFGFFVTEGRLDQILAEMAAREKELRKDVHSDLEQLRVNVRHDVRGELNSAKLGTEVIESQVRDLREEINIKVNEAITVGNSTAGKVHKRIDDIANVQGQMVGKMEMVVKAVEKASDAAQTAATAAAVAVEAARKRGGSHA